MADTVGKSNITDCPVVLWFSLQRRGYVLQGNILKECLLDRNMKKPLRRGSTSLLLSKTQNFHEKKHCRKFFLRSFSDIRLHFSVQAVNREAVDEERSLCSLVLYV